MSLQITDISHFDTASGGVDKKYYSCKNTYQPTFTPETPMDRGFAVW
jgi:hypothetical protein